MQRPNKNVTLTPFMRVKNIMLSAYLYHVKFKHYNFSFYRYSIPYKSSFPGRRGGGGPGAGVKWLGGGVGGGWFRSSAFSKCPALLVYSARSVPFHALFYCWQNVTREGGSLGSRQQLQQLADRMSQLVDRMSQLVDRMSQLADRMSQLVDRMSQLADRLSRLVNAVCSSSQTIYYCLQRSCEQLSDRMSLG